MTMKQSQYLSYIYPFYQSPKTNSKVTETMEYDEAGNLVKKTVVTETTTEQPVYPTTVTWNSGQVETGTISAETIKKPKPVPLPAW